MTVDIDLSVLNTSPVDTGEKDYDTITENMNFGSMKITNKTGIIYNMVTVTTDYNATRNDDIIMCENTADGDVTLPTDVPAGKQITVKNYTSAYKITIWGGVEGASSYELTNIKEAATLVYNGATWIITSSHLI